MSIRKSSQNLEDQLSEYDDYLSGQSDSDEWDKSDCEENNDDNQILPSNDSIPPCEHVEDTSFTLKRVQIINQRALFATPPKDDIVNSKINESVMEWKELVKNEKTRKTAIACLAYISNAFSSDFDYDDFEELDTVERHVAEIIDCVEEPKSTWFWSNWRSWDDTVVNKFLQRKDKVAWSKTLQSLSTGKSIKLITELIENKEREDSEEMDTAECMVENAVLSILNSLHLEKVSPLHEAVLSRDLDAVVMLLSQGVKVDAVDKDEKTALQLALERKFATITKALLVFGADPYQKFDKSNMSEELQEIMRIFPVEPVKPIVFDDSDSKPERKSEQIVNLLSLDGGGIRGLVTTTMLSEIDTVIPGFLDKITFSAGTSTGAILSMALAHGKSIAECRNIYFRLKDHVFREKSGAYYDETILEKFLENIFGDTTMEELWTRSRKKVIAVANSTVKDVAEVAKFKSYILRAELESPKTKQEIRYGSCFSNCERDICITCDEQFVGCGKLNPSPRASKLKDAARASSAAPFHFKQYDGYVDGGIGFNNPSFVLYTEFRAYSQSLAHRFEKNPSKVYADGETLMKMGAFLNVGTGKYENDRAPEEIQRGTFVRYISRFVTNPFPEITAQLKNVIKFFKRGTDCDTYNLNFLRTELPNNFFRLCPIFKEQISLDDTDNETLINMMWKTKVFMYEQFHGTEHSRDLQRYFHNS